MSSPKQSVAWSHFTQTGNIAICNYCSHRITHNPRYGTGNLVRHLKRKHEEISLDVVVNDEKSNEDQQATEQAFAKSSTVQSDFAVLIPIVKLEEEEFETEQVDKSPPSKTEVEETTEKPSKCEFCQSTFKTRRQLRIHLRTHTGERPFLCTECGKRYTQLGHLSDHLLVHTGVKTYHCSALHCNKAFYRRSELERHEKIHTGDKPHKCDFCSKSFAQKNNLVMHVKAHKNERPHICSVCQKGFITNSKLKLHAKKHERKMKKALAQIAQAQMRNLSGIIASKSEAVEVSSDSDDVATVGKKVRLFED